MTEPVEIARLSFTTTTGSSLRSLAFHPSRRAVAVGLGEDNYPFVMLWEVDSRSWTRVFEGHTRAVASVGFHPDGKLLASAGFDGRIKVWDVESGRERLTLGETLGILAVAYNPRTGDIAGGGLDGVARVWKADRPDSPATLSGHLGPIRHLMFSPDGGILASGSDDGTIRLWSPDDHTPLACLRGQQEAVSALAFSPNSALLASGGLDGSIVVWDVANGKRLASVNQCIDMVTGLSFHPHCSVLATAYLRDDSPLRLWRTPDLVQLEPVQGKTDEALSVAFSPDGALLACGGAGRSGASLELWTVRVTV